MKKALFATTALIATAGVASAEVTLSGYAEMGIKGGTGMETQFHDDIDVSFKLSGETDSGITFGAKIDLDEADVGAFTGGGTQLNAVWISGNFGTLTLGDTDGAFDWAMQELGWGTTLTDDHTTHGGFAFNSGLDGDYDGQVLRYDNTFGDFGVALSAELDDTGVADTSFGIGAKYNAALGGVDLGIGLGYQDNGTVDVWGLSLDASFAGGFSARLNYSKGDMDYGGVEEEHVGVGVAYSSGPLLVEANWGRFEEGASEQDGWGLGVNYDLGGGAVAMVGYGDTTSCGVYAGCSLGSTWSAGLGFSF